tara:strand:+ start:368 stop:544 length:177 start_codon:yes stop_codon:yes gene_type:complete
MLWKVIRKGKWWNVVIERSNNKQPLIVDGFDNQEDAERYKAHLEAEDSKYVTGDSSNG